MELDPLSALFAAVIALVTALAAIYGYKYLQAHAAGGKQGFAWLSFNLLAVAMLTVVAARNAVLFLASWELMSLASFFLVMHDDEKETVRRAGWIYLVAMHLGTAFLLAMFLLLGRNAGSLDFDQLSTRGRPRQRLLRPGRGRLRHEGRVHSAARLAARGTSGGARRTSRR